MGGGGDRVNGKAGLEELQPRTRGSKKRGIDSTSGRGGNEIHVSLNQFLLLKLETGSRIQEAA